MVGTKSEELAKEHDKYLKEEFGVVVEAIDASCRGTLEKPSTARREADDIRIMQWNILADGLSDDGFLVRDVLHATTSPNDGATASRESEFRKMVDMVQETVEGAKKDPTTKEAKLKGLKAQFAPPDPKPGEPDEVDPKVRARATQMTENHKAIVDWKRRWLKMRELIARYDPDVITLQEVDRIAELQRDLYELGCARMPTYVRVVPPTGAP